MDNEQARCKLVAGQRRFLFYRLITIPRIVCVNINRPVNGRTIADRHVSKSIKTVGREILFLSSWFTIREEESTYNSKRSWFEWTASCIHYALAYLVVLINSCHVPDRLGRESDEADDCATLKSNSRAISRSSYLHSNIRTLWWKWSSSCQINYILSFY